MKVAIFSISSHRDVATGWQQAIRDTWMKEWGDKIPCFFLMGTGPEGKRHNELHFDVDDSYEGMPFKTHAACRWAAQGKEYDYVFISCADTYVAVPRLLRSGFEGKDYVGCACDGPHLSGGTGYWLSRKAFGYLARCKPHGGYEDLWVGQQLEAANIPRTHDPRYHAPSYDGPPFSGDWSGGKITVHLSRGTGVYDPKWMINCHRSYLDAEADPSVRTG